jgi:hypothetical protein
MRRVVVVVALGLLAALEIGAQSQSTRLRFLAAPPACAGLTAPWDDEDIGSGQVPGSACMVDTTISLVGSGGIFGMEDQGHIAYQTVSGDYEIIARLVSINSTGSLLEVGGGEFCAVTIRNAIDADSAMAQAIIDGNGQAIANWRLTNGGASDSAEGGSGTWVRIVGDGEEASMFYGTNGVDWIQIGTAQDIGTMGSHLIGLTSFNVDNAETTTCVFDDIEIAESDLPEMSDNGCYRPQIPAFGGCETTTGGRDADAAIIIVSTLADDDNGLDACPNEYCGGRLAAAVCTGGVDCYYGSLREAIEHSGPRFVVFSVSGYIDLTEEILILEDDITIAFQTAPSPGITVRYYGIELGANNIVVQHARVRPGWVGDNCNQGMPAWNYSAGPNISNILVDHGEVSWAQDAGMGAGNAVHNIVYWRSVVAEALYLPDGSEGCTGGGANGGQGWQMGGDITGTIAESYSSTTDWRNPQINAELELTYVNVLVYQPGSEQGLWAANFDSGGGNGAPWLVTAVSNVWKAGPNGPAAGAIPYWWSDNAGTPPPMGNEIYISDHLFDDPMGVWSGGTLNELGYDPVVMSPPIALPMGYTPVAASALEAHVLSVAGARPLDRDAVSLRIIENIEDRTGDFVSDEDEVGGWPSLATNTAAVGVPTNPNGAGTCGASRSRIECALELMAQALEP